MQHEERISLIRCKEISGSQKLALSFVIRQIVHLAQRLVNSDGFFFFNLGTTKNKGGKHMFLQHVP